MPERDRRTTNSHQSRPLLRKPEVAERLAYSERTVGRLAARGELPLPVRLGSSLVRWNADEIDRYIENGGKLKRRTGR
jgi:excisionase family DNA binding protein